MKQLFIVDPSKVFTKDPCPLGLQEILTRSSRVMQRTRRNFGGHGERRNCSH